MQANAAYILSYRIFFLQLFVRIFEYRIFGAQSLNFCQAFCIDMMWMMGWRDYVVFPSGCQLLFVVVVGDIFSNGCRRRRRCAFPFQQIGFHPSYVSIALSSVGGKTKLSTQQQQQILNPSYGVSMGVFYQIYPHAPECDDRAGVINHNGQ